MSYFPDNVDEIRDAINILEKAIAELDGGVSVNVDTLTGTGETGRDVMKAPTPAKARDAIGAGTSSLKLGSTATTAMPGNTPIPSVPADATREMLDEGSKEISYLYSPKLLNGWVSDLDAAVLEAAQAQIDTLTTGLDALRAADPNVLVVDGDEFQRSGTVAITGRDITTQVGEGSLFRSQSFTVDLPPKPAGWSRQITISPRSTWSQWGILMQDNDTSAVVQLLCLVSRPKATAQVEWSLVKGSEELPAV